MDSRKRPKSATSTTRKRKRKAPGKDPAQAVSSDPDELTDVERDPEHPLSFLPKERRGVVAGERIVDQLVKLMNVVLEGANNVDADARETYLTIANVVQAMVWVATSAAKGPAPAAAKKALDELEHATMKVLSAFAPADDPLAPSVHWDLDQKYNLKGSKLAFLDVVAEAIEGYVLPREREHHGKLDTRVIAQAMLDFEQPNDNVTERAAAVAQRIHWQLATNQAFAKLLVRPANINYIPQDRAPLIRVISLLMEQGNATVPQVARAVLFVFGRRNVKNLFTDKLLKEWAASRATRAASSQTP